MTIRSTILRASLAGALALTLAACGSDAGDTVAEVAPIAEIAPPAGQQWADITTITDRGGYTLGNPDAPIKLVEYGSLTCPGCAGFSVQASETIREKYIASGRVSLEFRSFAIHGPIDLALTRLITCGSPEAVHPLSEQIWANLGEIQQRAYANPQALEAALQQPETQRFVSFAEVAGLYDFFTARGLSEDQAKTCLADWPTMQKLANFTQSYAQDDKISSTPTFLLNGRQLDDGSWTAVEAALQRAGAR
jgi:protein-disulfide isomerase